MKVVNLTAWTDEEFLADSIRCWQEALARRDWIAFEYWAVHSIMFARTLKTYCYAGMAMRRLLLVVSRIRSSSCKT